MNTALCSARPRTARGRSVWRSPKTKRALRGRRFPIESRVVSRAAGAPRARVFGGECLAERPLRTQLRQFFRRWRGGPHVLPPMITEHSLCTFTVLESSDRGWQRANVPCSPVVLTAEVLAGVDEGRTLLFSLIRFLFIIWRISILTENDRMALV